MGKYRIWEQKAGAWQVETALADDKERQNWTEKKKKTHEVLVLLTAHANEPGAVASSQALGCHTASDDTQSDFRGSHFLSE